ncbi:MAG: hypothetical protein BA871_17335 [Desulfuromonadales bacterium C00003096]|jgi:predicted transcriptional regulator|nr:MAG: hypothetical protein BA871_17335 [Desulfuromonadales bacterium C00003096]
MPKRKKIEELEIAVLLSLYSKVKYSKHAHPKEETIIKGLRKDLRGIGKITLKNLVRKGYLIQHPTSGGMTYNLSQKGIDKLKEVKQQKIL